MEKYTPPWWIYVFSIGIIILGILSLKKWRKAKKYRTPNASDWEIIYSEWSYLGYGMFFIITGIVFLIISIYQACTGWVAK